MLTTTIQQLAKIHYSKTVEVKQLVGYDDLNFYIKTKEGEEFILKIAHSAQEKQILDLQNKGVSNTTRNQIRKPTARARSSSTPWLLPSGRCCRCWRPEKGGAW